MRVRDGVGSPPAPQPPDGALTSNSLRTLAELAPTDLGLRASPPSVHFSGWASRDGGSRFVVRVLNFAGAPQRLLVEPRVQPDPAHAGDEEAFWVDVEQAGPIAPGLAQAFTVTFTPLRGPKYYFAQVCVRGSAGGTLLVPLHAYPVASGFSLPREVDLGRVPLGRVVTRSLELRTSVPIPFSVALTPLVPHADISVAPQELLVPPNGTASLTVTYHPSSHTTAVAEFRVVTSTHAPGLGGEEEDLSAYGVPASRGASFRSALPLTLRVSGSSAPSMERDARVFAALEHSRGIALLEAAPNVAAAATAAALSETATWAARTQGGGGAEAKKEGEGKGAKGSDGGGEGVGGSALLVSAAAEGAPFFPPLPAPLGGSSRPSRWLARDPGLASANETLAAFKMKQENALLEALHDRDALVGVLASEMNRATGAPVDVEGARRLVAERLGGPTAPVDAYKQPGGGYGGDGTRVGADVAAKRRPAEVIRGVLVRGGLATQADVDAVLSEKPGYIPPSALGSAIQEKRDMEAAAAAAQARIAAATRGALGGTGGGASPPRAPPPLSFTSAPASFTGAGPVSPRTAARLAGHTTARGAAAQELLRGVPEAEAAAALRRAYAAVKAEKRAVGPALAPPALAAAVVGESFLFPVLQASPLEGLPELLALLARTPDAAPLDSGGLLDEALGVCGGTLVSGAERAAALTAAAAPRGADLLTPALAALVRAAAAPLLAPARLKEAVFLAEHAALDAAESGREMSSAPWRGEELLPVAAAAGAEALRAQLRALENAVARRLARTRRASLAVPPVGHLPVESRRRALADTEVRPLGLPPPPAGAPPRYAPLSAGALLETPLLRGAALPCGAPVVRAGARPPAPPSFRDTTGADAWVGRRAALDRFRASVAVAVAEERATARVGDLRTLLGGVAAGIAAAGEGGVHHEDVVTLTRVLGGALEAAGSSGGGGGGGSGGGDLNRSLATLNAVADIAPTMEAVRAAASDAVENGVRAVRGGDRWVTMNATGGAYGGARLDPAAWRIAAGRGADFWAATYDDTSEVGACASAAGAMGAAGAPRASAAALAAAAERRVGGWDLRLPIPGVRAVDWAPTAARLPEVGWRAEGEAGHTPLPVPVAPLHAAPEPGRPLRQGALHEGGAAGVLPLASGQPALDAGLSAALAACLDRATAPRGRLSAGGARHWELGEGLGALRGEAPPGGAPRPLADAAVGVPGVGGWDERTGAAPGPALEGSAPAALGAGPALAQPYAVALPDALSQVRGVAPPHAYAAGAVAAAPGGARAPTARWPLRAHAPLLDLNGGLATTGAQAAGAPGFSSLHALEAPPPPREPPLAAASPWLLHAAPPARSRPPLDSLVPLLAEVPPPPAPPGGRVRLPTDVTPPAARVYVLPPPPPPQRLGADVLSPGGAGASALWTPAGLPPLMNAPADEDALSDDSQSDPDDSGREEGPGGAPSPRGKRPAPTLAAARALLLPLVSAASAAAGAAQRDAAAAARAAQQWLPREAALDERAAASASGAVEAAAWLQRALQPFLAPQS